MIININQCASVYDETLNVLKFSAVAQKVCRNHCLILNYQAFLLSLLFINFVVLPFALIGGGP